MTRHNSQARKWLKNPRCSSTQNGTGKGECTSMKEVWALMPPGTGLGGARSPQGELVQRQQWRHDDGTGEASTKNGKEMQTE